MHIFAVKKVSLDIETLLKKNWTAFSGGGYSDYSGVDNPENDPVTEFFKMIGILSYTLQNASLNFSDVNTNDDGTITLNCDINASFLCTNDFFTELFEYAGTPDETLSIPITRTIDKVAVTNSGNFLRFIDSQDIIYDLSFISDTEAFLSIDESGPDKGENKLVLRLRAN